MWRWGACFLLGSGKQLEGEGRGVEKADQIPFISRLSISFFISLSVFATELLINRKRLPEGMRQVQGDWMPETGNSG